MPVGILPTLNRRTRIVDGVITVLDPTIDRLLAPVNMITVRCGFCANVLFKVSNESNCSVQIKCRKCKEMNLVKFL